MSTIPLALFFGCLATPALANDLIVGPPGSGAAFTDIQAAIDAAQDPMDVVFVLPGEYTGSLVIDHDVDVIGSGPEVTRLFPTTDGGVNVDPHLTIINLAREDRVRVVGFGTDADDFIGARISDTNVVVTDCQGAVTLAELELGFDAGFVDGFGGPDSVLDIEDCDRVVLEGCRIQAGSSSAVTGPEGSLEGRAGLRATRSLVSLNDCTVLGADGATTLDGIGIPGGPGVDLDGGSLTFGWTMVRGGDGGFSLQTLKGLDSAGAGGAGVRVANGGALRVDGAETSSATGGNGALTLPIPVEVAGLGAPAIDAPGLLPQVSADAILEGGFDGFGVEQAAASTRIELLPRTVALTSPKVRVQPGEALRLELVGPTNTMLVIFSDNLTSAPLALPGFSGSALIAPATSETLIPVMTDATGRATKDVVVPPTSFPGARRYIQAASLGNPAGPPGSISPPQFMTVGL